MTLTVYFWVIKRSKKKNSRTRISQNWWKFTIHIIFSPYFGCFSSLTNIAVVWGKTCTFYHCSFIFLTLVEFWPHYLTVWGIWHVWILESPPPMIQAPASCKLTVHWALRHRRWSPDVIWKSRGRINFWKWVWLKSHCKYINNLSVSCISETWVYIYYSKSIALIMNKPWSFDFDFFFYLRFVSSMKQKIQLWTMMWSYAT